MENFRYFYSGPKIEMFFSGLDNIALSIVNSCY